MINFKRMWLAVVFSTSLIATTSTFAQDSTSTDSSTPATTAPVEQITIEVPTQEVAKPKASRKGKMNAGGSVIGFYDYSRMESLYVNFSTDETITASGLGFKGFFEYGMNERFALGGDITYSYILDANFDLSVVTQSFWSFNLMGSYYFKDYGTKVQPYATFGGGALFSDEAVTPVLNLGVGMHYMFNEMLSLKAELLGKTSITHNRGEASIGLAVHF